MSIKTFRVKVRVRVRVRLGVRASFSIQEKYSGKEKN